MIRLKRFKRDSAGNEIKLNDPINLTQRLQVRSDASTLADYTLVGVIAHQGITLTGGGHYVYYHRYGDGWRCYNDAQVTKVPLPLPPDLNTQAYVLFYVPLGTPLG
jgi:ubiquitin C-terminal hydrolase